MMLYHGIIHSDERRVVKKILMKQEENRIKESWYGNLKEEAEVINIKVTAEEAKRKSKKEWKKDVKEKIRKEIDKQLNENRSTKLRFCKRRGIDTYLQDVHNETAK